MKLVLFDVDGTLVLTGGAGVRAMDRAFRDLFSVADAFAGMAMAGRTDWSILADAIARLGRELDDELHARFRSLYCRYLTEEILVPGRRKGVMPGVRPLLDTLATRDDIFLGLLTGNYVEAARIKLEHFDLWRYFACGAYGDDAADRGSLVPLAVTRARACGAAPRSPEDVFVVGDTPHDVACAAAAGARSIAVATGSSTVDALRASGAHFVFKDLRDADAFLRIVAAPPDA